MPQIPTRADNVQIKSRRAASPFLLGERPDPSLPSESRRAAAFGREWTFSVVNQAQGQEGHAKSAAGIHMVRLGISALSQGFITLGEKVFGRAGVRPIRWRGS